MPSFTERIMTNLYVLGVLRQKNNLGTENETGANTKTGT